MTLFFLRRAALVLAIAGLTGAISGARADEAARPPALNLGVGEAMVLHLARPAKDVVIGNPGVADVTVQNSTTLVVFGRKSGGTSLTVMDRRGAELIAMPVVVGGGGPNSIAVTLASGKTVTHSGGQVVNWACGGFTCVRMEEPQGNETGAAGAGAGPGAGPGAGDPGATTPPAPQ